MATKNQAMRTARLELMLLACISAAGAIAQTPTLANVEYARVNNQPLRLDIYLPSAPASGRPLVIFVHGGGWNSGNKDVIQPAMLPLLNDGIALASIDYRLVNTQHANLYGGMSAVIFPAAVHDVKAAIRFLRANASTYGLDPDRVGLWGSSAGSHLASLVALSNGNAALEGNVGSQLGTASDVQLAVDAYGPSDILRMGVDAALAGFNSTGWDAPNTPHAVFIGCGTEGMGAILSNLNNPAPPWPQCVAQANLANPVLQVDASDPPMWIGHANDDPIVPWPQSQRLFDALQSAGVGSTFVRAPSGGHQLQSAQYVLAREFVRQRFAALDAVLFADGFE
ncbi:MAG: alpha/beta hydrolase [Lysobacterales bacterium]